jgi:hypothetical protein
MIRVEAGSLITYLGFLWDLSLSRISVISEVGFYNIIPNIPSYHNKYAVFQYFAFLNQWVSLKEREFTYSKFQQIINSTTHQILCLGGSSIP